MKYPIRKECGGYNDSTSNDKSRHSQRRRVRRFQQFADAWAETGVETVPESWGDALTLLGQSGAGNDVFVRLLALRFGPLAPVWDDALTIMNGGM